MPRTSLGTASLNKHKRGLLVTDKIVECNVSH